jgi:hypothetical protein
MITPDFAAYAIRVEIHFHHWVASATIQKTVEGLLAKIAANCADAGAYLIGHIKCVAESKEKGMLAVSVVDASSVPHSRGHLEEGIEEMDLIINVLLYGLARRAIQDVVVPLAQKELSFPGSHLHFEDLDEVHEHKDEHDHH